MNHDSEKYLEKKLRDEVSKRKGKCLKFVSPGNSGVPDRIVIMPGGRVYFVELKTKGRTLDPLQQIWAKWLIELGCEHRVIDSENKLIEFLNEI